MAMKSGVPGAMRRRVFKRDGYRCKHCGVQGYEKRWSSGAFTHPTNIPGLFLSIDHVKPRSKGGPSTEGNLQTLCTHCNTIKGVRYA